MGLLGAEQFTPRATTYVFVNVVVAPRYVAQMQPGSGGLKSSNWKGATGAAKFTPRGTNYVFANVVVAPRYVARVQPGSGGL